MKAGPLVRWALLVGILFGLAAAPVWAAGAPLTLEFREVAVRDVLQMLAKVGKANIVLGPEVTGNVTLSLHDVSFAEALDAVLRATGTRARQDGGIYVITKDAPESAANAAPSAKVFPLQRLSPESAVGALKILVPEAAVATVEGQASVVVRATPQVMILVQRVIAELEAGPARSDVASASGSSSSGGTTGPAPVLLPPPPAPAPTTFEVKYASLSQVEQAVRAGWPNAEFTIDQAKRSLTGSFTPGEATNVTALIHRLDLQSAQIVIDARLEELTSDALSDLGTRGATQWRFNEGLAGLFSKGVATLAESDLAELNVLESDGRAKLLANPRLSVSDGKEATIHIGDRIPVEITDIQDGVKVTRLSFIDVGIILKVLAHLEDLDLISVQVDPEVSTVTSWSRDTNYPYIRTRQASTMLKLLSGQTVAIGGLKLQEDVAKQDGVPVLSRLPLIGWLFKDRMKEKKRDELAIFLTARVVSPYTSVE